MRKRLIKISGDKIFYTPEDFVFLSDTNFPESAGFSTYEDFLWEVGLVRFDKTAGALHIKITNYHPSNIFAFEEQTSTAKIDKIVFDFLELESLKPFLTHYVPKDFDLFLEQKTDKPSVSSQNIGKNPEQENLDLIQPDKKKTAEPVHYQETFSAYFKEAVFNLGFVSLQKEFDFYHGPIEFKIFNSEILPEFNYIKSFFPKVFKGKKKFSVKAWIEITDGKLTKTQATSPQIKKIDEALIDSIKQLRTLRIQTTTIKPEIDKSLFTPDDIFTHAEDDGLDGNVFNQTGKDILQTILNLKNIRNKKQLEYIAGYKHNPKQKIRFTLNPLFGFLFFIEGETMYHYCWELLNSHATYLWSFDKLSEPETQLKRVEASINLIREMGRNKYKQAYRQNILNSDILLSVINHKHAKSAFKDSFVYWKARFKECLV